jgi:hypothetical protein
MFPERRKEYSRFLTVQQHLFSEYSMLLIAVCTSFNFVLQLETYYQSSGPCHSSGS